MEITQYIDHNLDVDFYHNLFDEERSHEIFRFLENNIAFPVTKTGKLKAGRAKTIYGDCRYKVVWYGKTTYYNTIPWDSMPTLRKIKEYVEFVTKTKYNICVVQRYSSGKYGINPHRDREMTKGTKILGLSFGATRELRLSHQGTELKLDLKSGSAYCLNPPTNDYWFHSIVPDENITEPRISLTFRNYTCDN